MAMRLGVANGPLPMSSDGVTPALAAQLRAFGIRAVATHLGDTEVLLSGGARRVRAILDHEGIVVAQATGYAPNLVDAEPAIRRDAIARVRRGLAIAQDLGAVMVNTGVGSHHPTFAYGPHPENHSARSIDTLIANLQELCPEAHDRGLLLSLEPHLLTTLSDPDTIRGIAEGVGHPALRINFDPVNLIGTLRDVYDTATALGRIQAIIGPYLGPSAHVKDIRPAPALVLHLDEVPPGEGHLDWDAYFRVCAALGDGAALIVEHLDGVTTERALDFVRQQATRCGIELL